MTPADSDVRISHEVLLRAIRPRIAFESMRHVVPIPTGRYAFVLVRD